MKATDYGPGDTPMRTAILGAALTVTAALASTTPPAHATTSTATATAPQLILVATCTATLTGGYATPLDPGSTNAQQPDTLSETGNVTCVDDAGQPLIRGTMTRTTVLPTAQCSGIAYNDPSTTRITWSDGTTTNLTLDQANAIAVLGTTATSGTGAATTDSTKFTGDTIDAAVMATGPGCGTKTGQTQVDATMVFTLAH